MVEMAGAGEEGGDHCSNSLSFLFFFFFFPIFADFLLSWLNDEGAGQI